MIALALSVVQAGHHDQPSLAQTEECLVQIKHQLDVLHRRPPGTFAEVVESRH
jgi:hypothetical protein